MTRPGTTAVEAVAQEEHGTRVASVVALVAAGVVVAMQVRKARWRPRTSGKGSA